MNEPEVVEPTPDDETTICRCSACRRGYPFGAGHDCYPVPDRPDGRTMAHLRATGSDVDALLAEAEAWTRLCGPCDGGLPMTCTHPEGDPRDIIGRLAEALRGAR